MRQRAFTVIAHWPWRSPLSLCNPTLLSGLKSCRVLATFNTDNKSSAQAKSKPRNLLDVSPSQTLRLAALCHDRIMAITYYGRRIFATVASALGGRRRCPVKSAVESSRGVPDSDKMGGLVQADQLRSGCWAQRGSRFIGKAPASLLDEVRARLKPLLGL